MNMRLGRPSKYRPEYCEQLIKHMAAGYSFESFGAVVEVGRATLYRWEDEHEDFRDAKSIGMVKNLKWMEDQAMAGMFTQDKGPKLNQTLWIFIAKARHRMRDDYKDDKEIERSNSIKIDSDDEAL